MSNYIIRQDGDQYFASTDDFINLQESEVAFGDTPQKALGNYLTLLDEKIPRYCYKCRSTVHDTADHDELASWL